MTGREIFTGSGIVVRLFGEETTFRHLYALSLSLATKSGGERILGVPHWRAIASPKWWSNS